MEWTTERRYDVTKTGQRGKASHQDHMAKLSLAYTLSC